MPDVWGGRHPSRRGAAALSGAPPRIAVVPFAETNLLAAVEAGGGAISDADTADGLIWTNPADPESLKETLASSPARWIQLPFAGIEEFVAAGALDTSRTWTCAKGAYGHACAEHALALMLAAARRIPQHARARRWEPGGLGRPEFRLKDKDVLVFGAGGIGRDLIRMLQPLQARCIAVNRSGRAVPGAERVVTTDALRSVLPAADFVVLAAAVTAETRGLFDGELLGKMKRSAWLVNVARGVLVVTDALVDALRSGTIAGAALDVTEPEPLPQDHPLWGLDNVVVTPHIANTWDMALPDLAELVRRNVDHFGRGEDLEGVVDPELGY